MLKFRGGMDGQGSSHSHSHVGGSTPTRSELGLSYRISHFEHGRNYTLLGEAINAHLLFVLRWIQQNIANMETETLFSSTRFWCFHWCFERKYRAWSHVTLTIHRSHLVSRFSWFPACFGKTLYSPDTDLMLWNIQSGSQHVVWLQQGFTLLWRLDFPRAYYCLLCVRRCQRAVNMLASLWIYIAWAVNSSRWWQHIEWNLISHQFEVTWTDWGLDNKYEYSPTRVASPGSPYSGSK